ncbi:MAG TPA: hypothetical protein VK571_05580 [Gemmatimonadaceae bacterium]|nr:hypothetical protein [Gemmatimonadaceae bacterium]
MRAIRRIVASMSVASLVMGCGEGDAGGTVNYNPANGVDATKPTINLLIRRASGSDVEVQGQNGPSANLSTNFGDPAPNAISDFSVLATAKDPESGIKNLRIVMTRTVCFTGSTGGNNGAPFATVTRKTASWTDQTKAPTAPSLGETGIIDNRPVAFTPDSISETNLIVFKNAQGNLRQGVGVATKWGAEATNFAGQTTYSDAIRVFAGSVTCPALP